MELLTHIDKEQVLKYLGYRGGNIDTYKKMLDDACRAVLENARPQLCESRLRIMKNDPLMFENADMTLEGEDIKKLLVSSEECVFIAATLGSEIDTLIKKASVIDMAWAVMLDACASAAIENVCDNYTKELEDAYEAEGMYITDRYSPGYGDLPLESQGDFCAVTQSRKRIGLSHNRAMMLEPTKSVTAVIGVSTKKQPKRITGCASCKLINECGFRKRGVTCYEKTL